MTLTHLEKRERVFSPALADLGYILAGAAAYSVVAAAASSLLPGLILFRPAAAVLVLSALLGGPVVGFGAGFLGDLLLGLWQGGIWLHWSLGAGLAGALTGLLWLWSDIDATAILTRTDLQKISFFACGGFLLGALAPGLVDILLGASPSLALVVWAAPTWITNSFWGVVLGTLLLALWKNLAGRLGSVGRAGSRAQDRTARRRPEARRG